MRGLGKPELRMVTLSNGSTLSLIKLVNHHGNTEDLVAGKLKSTAYKIKNLHYIHFVISCNLIAVSILRFYSTY